MDIPNRSLTLPENYSELQIRRIQQRLRQNGIRSQKYWIEHRNGQFTEIIIYANESEHPEHIENIHNEVQEPESSSSLDQGILQDGSGRQNSSSAKKVPKNKKVPDVISDNMVLYQDTRIQFLLR